MYISIYNVRKVNTRLITISERWSNQRFAIFFCGIKAKKWEHIKINSNTVKRFSSK